MRKILKKIILLCGDISVLYISLYLTLLVRYLEQPSASAWALHIGPFSLAFFFWLIIFYISDLYNLHYAVNNSKFFNITFRAVAIAGGLSAVFFYVNPNINIAPKTNLLIYLIIFTIIFILWRRLFNRALLTKMTKENIAVIGYDPNVQEIIDTLRDQPHLGYNIKLIVSSRVPRGGNNEMIVTEKIIGLKETIIKQNISTIIFATNPRQSPELRKIMFSCLPLKIDFVGLPGFYEHLTGKIPIEAISQMWFLENLNEGGKKWFNIVKRAYDIIFAFSILLVTALLWPLIGIIIKLESKGPIFYYSLRAGLNGNFKLVKFRTMREENNQRTLTTTDDPRVTAFGSFLRKTRIDEIPQVLNILAGHMSFVGPRPERPEFISELKKEIPFYEERLLAKPGLTGWDQVSGEYHSPTREDTLKKLQYDLYYVKNRSVYLDLSIILKTIATVLRRGGV